MYCVKTLPDFGPYSYEPFITRDWVCTTPVVCEDVSGPSEAAWGAVAHAWLAKTGLSLSDYQPPGREEEPIPKRIWLLFNTGRTRCIFWAQIRKYT